MVQKYINSKILSKNFFNNEKLEVVFDSYSIPTLDFSKHEFVYTRPGAFHEGTKVTGVPKRFEIYEDGSGTGASDHFPVAAKIKIIP